MKRTIQKLPIGIENFEKLRQDDFYYIDKTGLIREIIQNWSEVTLFTRPRRFGKSLNMSMLKSFFSVKGDKQIFEGLEIAREKELCEMYMGKFPVVLISLKEISAASYDTAYRLAVGMINEAAAGLEELSGSSRLSKEDREAFRRLRRLDMEEPEFLGSLRLISRLLYRHYGQRVIILIDEYDVPLAKASENGYYDKMVNLMRGFLGQARASLIATVGAVGFYFVMVMGMFELVPTSCFLQSWMRVCHPESNMGYRLILGNRHDRRSVNGLFYVKLRIPSMILQRVSH